MEQNLSINFIVSAIEENVRSCAKSFVTAPSPVPHLRSGMICGSGTTLHLIKYSQLDYHCYDTRLPLDQLLVIEICNCTYNTLVLVCKRVLFWY